MKLDPKESDRRTIYKVLTGAVVPRPIAWVSTIGEDGVLNVAPFSYYAAVCGNPPIICFSVNARNGGPKDTTSNIKTIGDFVVNVVTEELAEAMNITCGEYPADVDEFQLAKLTPVPSDLIKSPRVGESPINMECKFIKLLEFGIPPDDMNSVFFGEVVRFHVKDEYISDYRMDFEKLKPLGRLAGNFYSRGRELFEMKRPVV